MNFIEASVLIIFIAIIFVPIANRIHLPLEVFLFLGSCFISLIPGLPEVKLDPMIVFDLFLPPILFSAAFFTSWNDFKFNLRPISQLAFGLVIFNAVVVAVVAKLLLPDFSWAESFLLGAIISPTDASAATSIIKKLGVPRRFITIIEGESLINDATALLIYRFSLIAILTGSFSFSHAVIDFILITLGGCLVGFLIGYLGISFIKTLKNVQAETTFTLVTAFAAYAISERCGFSGVISTVVAGLYAGIYFPEVAPTHTKVNAKASWSTTLFVINGFVFTLIGFQLPTVFKNLQSFAVFDLIFYGCTISLVVILARLLWIYPSAAIPRFLFPSIAKKDPMPSKSMLFGIGWTGMRGIVSLAAVLAIPNQTKAGIPIQHLDLLIFITYFVMFLTLIIPSLTLPFMIKFLKLSEIENRKQEEVSARLLVMEEVLKTIPPLAKKQNIPEPLLEEFFSRMERRRDLIDAQLKDNSYSTVLEEYYLFKKLAILAIKVERTVLIEMRKNGKIHEDIFHKFSDELDIEELQASTLRL